MSLVVAYATEDGPRLVSDTRVTLRDGQRSSYKTGSLKAVVLNPKFSICFAGDVLSGLRGIRKCAALLAVGESAAALLTTLTALTVDKHVEFLVAQGGGGPQLARVREGSVEHDLSTAWIGDHKAFARFQQERLSSDPLEATLSAGMRASSRAMHRLQRAMHAVIADPAIASVGDFCVSVAYKDTGFEYLSSIFIHVGRDIQVQDGDNLIDKMAHPVEEGGYSVSVVEPAHAGTPALGLSFPRARLGMIYLPLLFDGAEVLHNVSPKDFSRVVLERFGVAMKDPPLR